MRLSDLTLRFRGTAAAKRCLALAAVPVLAFLLTPRAAHAQLEEFGIQNTNNSAALQQQQIEAQKQDQLQTGQCTDPDPSNCGGNNAGGGLGTGNGSTGNNTNFQFRQPQENGYNNGRNERYQPQYTFRPEQPTEFQRYVGDATGIWLPIFGQELFTGVPSTFAPLDNSPVPQDYVVGPGDQLLLQAYGQINFDLRLTVDRAGDVEIPKVGTVRVAGLKFSQLQPFLQQQVARQFRNFTLNVQLGQLRTMQVYVTGEARRPGSFILSSLSTLVNAIFAVGGPSADGSLRNIEVRRDGQTITHFDVYDLLLRGDKSKDVALLPGDVIFFPKAGPRVAVFGSVDRPAIYELKGNASVGKVLDLAGGLTAIAANQHAEVERIQDHQLRHVLEISLDAEGRSAKLEDGDVLRVYSFVPRFDNAIVLRGNVANPGTYAWHDGMRVHELFPDKDSLLTRDYWKQRAKLGLPVLDYQPVPVANVSADTQTTYQQRVLSGNELNRQASDRAIGSRGFNSSSDMGSTQARPNELNSSMLGTQTTTLQSNTIGNAAAAGSAPPLAQQFPPQNLVELQSPDIDWSYAVIERTDKTTLKTELIPFHLGALVLNGDESQDVALQPGDVVTIFSQADIHVPRQEQTRFVHIEGEVAHAGVYSVQPGETLRQVVERAGGLTPNAYLYGASFTRETVRQQQQQRLDEYINELSEELQHSAEQLAANGGASGGEGGSAQGIAQANQQSIARLRQLRASGRVVLSMAPSDHDVAAIPDLQLEDGDHLVIPPVPSSVTVVGSVYNQSSFVFEEGRREGDYLRQAGGPNRLADARHEFIVRADGAVVSRNFSSGKLLSSFGSERMNPGDTIIVPQKLVAPSLMRSFLEYSSVFSSIALTAATIAILQ